MSQTGIIINVVASTLVKTLTGDDGVAVSPLLGNIDVLGGPNINTVGDAIAHSITFNLDTSIQLPITNAAGDEGVIALGATALPGGYITDRFIHAYGTDNTFLGLQSGNMTLDPAAVGNTGLGASALQGITLGISNTAAGESSGIALTSGQNNSFFGRQSGVAINSGSDNILIGYLSGLNLTTESSNIMIGNQGIAADANTVRIGAQGVGAAQQDTAFIAGIYQGAGAAEVVLVDATGELGSSAGNDGELLIGATGAAPIWATLTAGVGVAITNAANSITIDTGGPFGPFADQFITDDGNFAVPNGTHELEIAGINNIVTSATGAGVDNIVNIALDSMIIQIDSIQFNNGGVLQTDDNLGDTLLLQAYDTNLLSYTTFATLTAGNLPTMDLNTLVTIDSAYIYRVGGTDVAVTDGGTGVSTLTDHGVMLGSGVAAVSVTAAGTDGQVLIAATGADPAFATIASAGGTIVFTPGANTLNMETGGAVAIQFDTTAGNATPAAGILTFANGTNITMSGAGSTITTTLNANLITMDTITFNTGGALRTGTTLADTFLLQGYDTNLLTYTTFATLTAGNLPTMDLEDTVTKAGGYIYRAGGTDVPVTDGGTGVSTLTDHGVVLGSGVAAVSVTAAGTNGQVLIAATGADPAFATIASAGGTIAFTPGANTLNMETGGAVAIQFNTTAGNATPAAGILTLTNGTNILMSGAGSAVTVNVRDSIQLPTTTASGTTGMIAFGATALPGGYETDRFVHNFGTQNTFLGYQSGRVNVALTASYSIGIGYQALTALTTGDSNVMIGNQAGTAITTAASCVGIGDSSLTSLTTNGNQNTAVGAGSLAQLLTGTDNCVLGYHAGYAFTGTESDNIIIGSAVGVVGDNNTVRIGAQGAGAGQQDTCYIAGIYGGAATEQMVVVDSTGLLGSAAIPTGGLNWTSSTGLTQLLAADNGYILNNAAGVICTMPATSAIGTIIRLVGKGAGGWSVVQLAGQTIHFGSTATTTGITGSIASTNGGDAVEMVCITANTDWSIISSVGNITVV